MGSRWSLWAALSGIFCLASVGYMTQRVASAHEDLMQAVSRRDALVGQVRQFRHLQAQRQDTLYGKMPQSDFEQRIGEAIEAASIRPAPMYSISVQADRDHRDARGLSTGLREQRASVTLGGLSPSQIGGLLVYWHQTQQLWSPDRISLEHDQRSPQNRYTLRLECVAVYNAQGTRE